MTAPINVKDFGATGDGVTDDWAAIMRAFNHGQVTLIASGPSVGTTIPFAGGVPAAVKVFMWTVNTTNPAAILFGAPVLSVDATSVTVQYIDQTIQAGDEITFNLKDKGTIYFPPGTYKVSQPISLKLAPVDPINFCLIGELGASTITGNFADYVLSRGGDGSASPMNNVIENLTIVNTHASGGGIRLAMTSGGAIRNCDITANKGINTEGIDDFVASGNSYFGSFEISIENCRLSPGSNYSGSQGIMTVANGPIINCQFIGYETGLQTFGGQGAMSILGCYFEQCGTGYLPGYGPDMHSFGVSLCITSGCRFKDNSIAIDFASGTTNSLYAGIRIEGTNGQAPSGTNPQYGIKNGNPGSGSETGLATFAGITVTGDYAVAGISFQGVDSYNKQNTFKGVHSVSWDVTYADTARFFACNRADVYTFAHINAAPEEGASWSVSDSNSATWGATAAGGGSTHAKLRYNGSNWTVAGK